MSGVRGWWLLALVLDAPGPRWSPAWSDALDQAIIKQRKQNPISLPDTWRKEQSTAGRTIDPLPGAPRGLATPEEVQRRRAADRALGKKAPTAAPQPVRMPKPRPTRTGKFVACVIHNGVHYRKTFTTYAAAEAFIREVKSTPSPTPAA